MRSISYDIELQSKNINVQSKKANGIIFKNLGDVDATVGGIPLPAGESINDFAQNFPGDVIVNAFDLKFKAGTLGVNPLVVVIRINTNDIPKERECDFKN